MRVHLSNSDYLGNFDTFLRGLDLTDEKHLKVTAHDRWVSIHPVILTTIAALRGRVDPANIAIDIDPKIRSAHYLERMGLFNMLGIPSPFTIVEHEQAGSL